MSYLVLARKWRPQTFRDLIGQEHVSQTLKNAIDSGRVAHAFLFTGARGVGKTSSARILAKALNCEKGPTPEPCNACPACLEITAGNSVDVFEIDGASNTGVDDIRELRDNVKYLPSRSRYKIFIIDEVHMLSTNAFNALLKTLEEPPPHVKFIFATTEPHKVPITILSRCQRFDFRRIPLPKLAARLRYIVDREGVEIGETALALIARKGDGSMRDSLSVLDQVLAFCGETVNEEEVAGLLGVVDRRLLLDASRAVFARDCQALLDVVRQIDAVGYSMRQFCQELIGHFRNLAVVRAVRDPAGLLELSDGELAAVREQASAARIDDLQRHLTLLLRADAEMAHSSFPRLILEMALLKMARLAPVVPVGEILERLKRIEGGFGGGNEPRATPARAGGESRPVPAPAQGAPKGGERPAGDWPGFVSFVKGRRPRLGSLLEHGSPLTLSPERIEIGFPPGLHSIQDADTQAALQEFARGYFRGEPAIRFVSLGGDAGSAPPTLHEKKKREEREELRRLEREAKGHPMVTAALEIFGGEIGEVTKLE